MMSSSVASMMSAMVPMTPVMAVMSVMAVVPMVSMTETCAEASSRLKYPIAIVEPSSSVVDARHSIDASSHDYKFIMISQDLIRLSLLLVAIISAPFIIIDAK